MYRATLLSDTVKIENVKKENIWYAFKINLPFRLKVGTEFRVDLGGDNSILIVFKNLIDIPTNEEWKNTQLKYQGSWDKFWTKSIVIIRKPEFNDSDLEAFKDKRNTELGIVGGEFSALSAINNAILAYSSATHDLFSGKHIHQLTDTEFFGCLEGAVLIVKGEENLEDLIESILNVQPDRLLMLAETYNGTLEDLPEEKIQLIQSYVEKIKDKIFYDFALKAKSNMVERDFIAALLMVVVALEGVHAAYLRKVLTKKLEVTGNDVHGLI